MTEEQRAAAIEQMKRDSASAMKPEDIAQKYLRAGADPRYISSKYGIDLDRCVRYATAFNTQQEMKRERENAARGNCEAPPIGEGDHGSGSIA
jgi:hypothetical protein